MPSQWKAAEGDAISMATPPISQKTLELQRRRRWLSRRALMRGAWLTADVVAIAACAVLALRGLT